MAYDAELTARLSEHLAGIPGLSEKRMMGGMCFMINGNMVGGADRSKSGEGRFMFRIGKQNHSLAQAFGTGTPMVQGGRRMTGFFFVAAKECSDHILTEWVSLAVGHALSLPAK